MNITSAAIGAAFAFLALIGQRLSNNMGDQS